MAKAQPQKQTRTAEATREKPSGFEDLLRLPIGSNGRVNGGSINAIRRAVYNSRAKLVAALPFKKSLSEHEQVQAVDRICNAALRQIERMIRDGNDKILACTGESIVDAIQDAALDGLLIDGRLAYFVPYSNVAKYSPSYIGMLTAARKAGAVLDGYACEIYDGEPFEFREEGGEQVLTHSIRLDAHKDGKIVGAWAKVVLPDGRIRYEVASLGELDAIRSKSKAAGSFAWKDFAGQMYRKSVFRRLLKWYASDPFLADFLARADDAEYVDPRDFEKLVDRPVAASRASILASSFQPTDEPPHERPADTMPKPAQPAEPETEPVKCAKCGGAVFEEVIDGEPVLVCSACDTIVDNKPAIQTELI